MKEKVIKVGEWLEDVTGTYEITKLIGEKDRFVEVREVIFSEDKNSDSYILGFTYNFREETVKSMLLYMTRKNYDIIQFDFGEFTFKKYPANVEITIADASGEYGTISINTDGKSIKAELEENEYIDEYDVLTSFIEIDLEKIENLLNRELTYEEKEKLYELFETYYKNREN